MPSLGPLTPYLIHSADWVVSVLLQGLGPCLLWNVPGHYGLSWCLGSLSGSLCYFWVPGYLPFGALHGYSRKYQSPFLGSEHSLVLGSDSDLGPSIWKNVSLQSMRQVLRTGSLEDGSQVSASPEPSGSAASHPTWSQLLPLPLSDFVPACRGSSVPQEPCQPCPRCPTTCQKL